ncbi:hypothetical protein E4U17_000708 [Claviceps sp. LM77 group G4]|nr:hypothetical protein E4U17_000708 [Claviceps sp. LM77 group G4]KAG6077515.1 hypothetical protein E4U33_001240 [Claviceps sp. LM78 group G4]
MGVSPKKEAGITRNELFDTSHLLSIPFPTEASPAVTSGLPKMKVLLLTRLLPEDLYSKWNERKRGADDAPSSVSEDVEAPFWGTVRDTTRRVMLVEGLQDFLSWRQSTLKKDEAAHNVRVRKQEVSA